MVGLDEEGTRDPGKLEELGDVSLFTFAHVAGVPHGEPEPLR